MSVRKIITAAITALTLGTAVAAPGQAQAMGFGGLAAAGIIGDIALGAARAKAGSRRGVIVEHRYVRKGNRLGDRQDPADRLDPVERTMLVDEGDHDRNRRSSSA